MKKISIGGQSLVGVLTAMAVTAILMMSFLQMFKSQVKATRRIAALGGVTDLSHALDILFKNDQCTTTGNAAAALSPAVIAFGNAGSPAVVTVSGTSYFLSMDTMTFANGSIAVTSTPNSNIAEMIQPYTIASLTFDPLGGNSATEYPFRMQVVFTAPQNGFPPAPVTKFVTIYTDGSAANRVVGACLSRPSGNRCTSVNALANLPYGNAEAVCNTDEQLTSCITYARSSPSAPNNILCVNCCLTGAAVAPYGTSLRTATSGVCGAYCNGPGSANHYEALAICCKAN